VSPPSIARPFQWKFPSNRGFRCNGNRQPNSRPVLKNNGTPRPYVHKIINGPASPSATPGHPSGFWVPSRRSPNGKIARTNIKSLGRRRMINFLNKIRNRLFRQSRPFRLTRGGWVFILYTIGVGAGAINTGNNLLYLAFGVFLGLILASGVLSDLSLWRIEVELKFPENIQGGETNLIGFTVHNRKKRFPSLSLTIEVEGILRGEPIILKKYIPILFGQEKLSSNLVFHPTNRGLFQVTNIKLATRFPFGLLYKWWNQKERYQCIVFPETVPVFLSNVLLRSLGEEKETAIHEKGDGSTIHHVREYNESDNPRRIHWKASARRSSLGSAPNSGWIVREMEAEEREKAWLLWPALDFLENCKPAEIDNFVRFSASLVCELYKANKEVHLIIPDDENLTKIWSVVTPNEEKNLSHILSFLALFEGDNPRHARTMQYLSLETPAQLSLDLEHQVDVYRSYIKWAEEKYAEH